MTKMIKMSLIAAVAVTGMTSVASAKPLEEAIKGVDASGYVTYRYDDVDQKDTAHAEQNVYKVGLKLVTKATDDVKVTLNSSFRAALTDSTGDGSGSYGISHANFTYTGVQGLSLIAGKQALNTPWTQGSSTIDSTQAGTGVLGMYTAGAVTVAAGHFLNNGINGTSNSDTAVNVKGNDLTVAAVIAKVGDLGTAQAWFVNVGEDVGSTLPKGAKAYSLNFAGKASVVDFDARYSALKSDASGADTYSLAKLVASANLGAASVTLGYGKTGTDGGLVAFDGDGDAGFSGDQLDLNNLTDTSAMLLSVGADVAANLNVSATYLAVDLPAGTDPKEMYLDATYTAAKNLYVSAKLGSASDLGGVSGADAMHARLQIGFTF